jgi:hypothetical protein
VRTLEALLGRKLFVRNKAAATLTPTGEQLENAPSDTTTWPSNVGGRQASSRPQGFRAFRTPPGFLASRRGHHCRHGGDKNLSQRSN